MQIFGKPKKKRGRPRKKVVEKKDDFPDEAVIEVSSFNPTIRGPFSLSQFGVKEDPTKQRRWVRNDRIDERKYNDGFTLVGGKATDGTVRTKGNMVLMERSRDKADVVDQKKQEAVARQTSTSKEDFDRRMVELSRRHGRELT